MGEINPPGRPRPRPAAGGNPIPDDAQKVFDVVAGPNLRLIDNLIQLAAIVAGTAVCAGGGAVYCKVSGQDVLVGVLLGGAAGLLGSLLFSGFVIGLVRTVLSVKR